MSAAAEDRELTLRPEFHRRDLAKCALCGKGLMHTGLPLFWRVTVERFGVDMTAVQRESGMEMFFGGTVGLAVVFSDGRPLAKRIDLSGPQLVCEECCTRSTCIAAIAERGQPDEEAEPAEQTP